MNNPIYEVLSYDDDQMAHRCQRSDGRTMLVDLMVNGDFPPETDPKSLVGRQFAAEYDHGHVVIAHNVREVK